MSTVSEVVDAICKSLRERPEEWVWKNGWVERGAVSFQKSQVWADHVYINVRGSGMISVQSPFLVNEVRERTPEAVSESEICASVLEALK